MIVPIIKQVFLMMFITSSMLVSPGCIWLDRPSTPELTGIPDIEENYETITVVRKKEYSASGTIFTLALDDRPFVHLEHAHYTTFRVSPGKHVLKVIWDIAGFAIVGPGGGAIGDSPHRYHKEIEIQCGAGEECFYTMEGVVFVKRPEEGLVFDQVERLGNEYSLENKELILPKIQDDEHTGAE